MSDRRPARTSTALAAGLGVVFAVGLGVLLARLFTVGMSQTYDTLLYGRSLWGVAHGEAFNPAYGTHWLGIHANVVFFALAPFVRSFDAWQVLVAAQAIALGCSVAMIVREVLVVTREAAGVANTRRVTVLSVVWALVAVVLSPLFINPFLFDARPDLIGVPLLVAAFLRVERRNGWDTLSAFLVVLAALVREELAVVGAAGMLGFVARPSRGADTGLGGAGLAGTGPPSAGLDEMGRPNNWGWPRRVLVGGVLVALAAAYWFFVRKVLPDDFAADRANRAFLDLFGGAPDGTSAYRLELALALVSFGGGLVLLGWRWLLAAAPGLAFVVLSTKQPENALNFHYALLASPALVVASVAGLKVFVRWGDEGAAGPPRLRPSPWWRSVALAVTMGVAFASTVAFGAHPLGARFRGEHFGFDGDARVWLDEAHALLATIPPGEGTAIAPMFAAPFSDRREAWSLETLHRHVRAHGAPPGDVQWIAIENTRFTGLGRVLVMRHGFTLEGLAAGRVALLRAPTSPPRAPGILERVALPRCQRPVAQWLDAGLGLCDVHVVNERVVGVVMRLPDAPDTPPLALVAEVAGVPVEIEAWAGMFDLGTLPDGVAVPVLSRDRVRAPEVRFHVQDRDGRAYLGVGAESAPAFGVSVRLRDPQGP